MVKSYLITEYFILASKAGTVSSQNGMQRNKRYPTAMEKNEKPNDFQNTAFTTGVDIVVRKLWYSNCRSNEHLFGQCSSRDLQFKSRIKHKFAI